MQRDFPKFNVLLTVHLVYQYSETNMMHFLFNLLRIKGLYMFRASLLSYIKDACSFVIYVKGSLHSTVVVNKTFKIPTVKSL
jgi:hypothetical protein